MMEQRRLKEEQDKETKRKEIKAKILKMKEDRIKSKRQMEANTKNLNIIIGEERKKRIHKDLDERNLQDIEMPELERRKHELAKRRNFINHKHESNSIKSGKNTKFDKSLVEKELMINQSFENLKSKQHENPDLKSIGSNLRLNNYSENRSNIEGRHKNLSSKGSQLISHQFHPKEINGENADDSTEVINSKNSKSINKIQVNHYYHNVKALENVLKEEKESIAKRELNKKPMIQRKEKSYSKLAREIHWDGKTAKRLESQELNNQK